jgi:hypothetical protein
MRAAGTSSSRRGHGARLIARIFCWFFLINFILNAVQLIVYGLAPLFQPDRVPMNSTLIGLSAFFAVICLVLAIGLNRIANRET